MRHPGDMHGAGSDTALAGPSSQSASDERVSIGLRASAGALFAVTLGMLIADIVLTGAPPGEVAVALWLFVTAAVATLVLWLRGSNRVAWLMLGAVGVATSWLLLMTLTAQAVEAGELEGFAQITGWLAQWVGVPPAGAFIFVFLLFPAGRLPGPRWRWVVVTAAVGVGLVTISLAFSPGPLEGRPEMENPLGISGMAGFLAGLEDIGSALVAVSAAATFASLIVRWRRSEGDQRHQVKWVLFGAALLALGVLFASVAEGALNEASFVALLIGLFAIPVTFGIALLRYRLFDIDIVINRTIVYLALTAAIVVTYILLVGAMGSLFQQRVGLGPALVATAVVAVLFQPLRQMLQRIVDRAMFGERRDPYAALSRLGERLDATIVPEDVLPAIVQTLAGSLKLPYVAIEVEREGGHEVVAGTGAAEEVTHDLPLNYQGQRVGRLVISERRGDPLSGGDRRLLEDLARQAGAAVHTVALTDALRRSRDESVSAREEERRRLRRDLHDGLGPELAGITLGLAAARNLKDRDPDTADALFARLQDQTDSASRSVRTIVGGLRDGALDELGLVEALRQKLETLGTGSGVDIDFVGPMDLPSIPAAVEVAALRIALEAATNVVRHADANRCWVRLQVNGELTVEVVDDGRGIGSSPRSGVGLSSMAERAAEVGGTFEVGSRSGGGTRVRACLPLDR